MSVTKEWVRSLDIVGKSEVAFTNTVAIKWKMHNEYVWYTGIITDRDNDRIEGDIHHITYCSDGREEWVDFDEAGLEWRLLPKNWMEKQKKFLKELRSGKKRKKSSKGRGGSERPEKRRKTEKRARKKNNGTLTSPNVGRMLSNGGSKEPYPPLEWDTERPPKKSHTYRNGEGVDFSLPNGPKMYSKGKGSSRTNGYQRNSSYYSSTMSAGSDLLASDDEKEPPRQLYKPTAIPPFSNGIPTPQTPPHSMSLSFKNGNHLARKKKTKQKKKRKNKKTPEILYKFIKHISPHDVYFRRWTIKSVNGRRFTMAYMFLCPYGGFFTAWAKKSSRFVTLPKLSKLQKTEEGMFEVFGDDKAKCTWVLKFQFLSSTEFRGKLFMPKPEDSKRKQKSLDIHGTQVMYTGVEEQSKRVLGQSEHPEALRKRLQALEKMKGKLRTKVKKLEKRIHPF